MCNHPHTFTHAHTPHAYRHTFWSVMYENYFLHDSTQPPPNTPYLWLCFLYLPPHRCCPFISCSGIPVKASLWLVSWTKMDTGGQRKCPHGWDQSTVLGLWQWPWRLIISPQKCSFMLLISCKLVSGFSVKAIFLPTPVTENPNGDGYDQKVKGVSFLLPSCLQLWP